jgi:Zinc dependent phospholipase C
MPSWYVHIEAAAETLDLLNNALPPGSPLTATEATQFHTAGHDHRNYLAAGALGPDLFFLLPDFKGDISTGLLKLVRFALGAWDVADAAFIEPWEKWMTPVLDDANQLASGISGGMLGEIGEVHTLVAAALTNLAEGLATQMGDLFGLLTSGTQAGFEDSAFFWSDMFHYRKTYTFARTLYKNALQADEMKTDPAEPSRVPKQQAFALGWISHCATDVAGHPFTNAKTGGPFRTHWQRHHVVENHMDGLVYKLKHGIDPMACYSSLDTSALHFRLAFQQDTDPMMPADVPTNRDWFPGSWTYPNYLQGEHLADRNDRAATFDVDSEPLPDHICELLLRTMQEVYGGPNDMDGPQVLSWDGPNGRPTVQMLKDMFDLVYRYVKMSTSAGLSPRMPLASAEVITDHDLPRPPGAMDDTTGANPNDTHDITVLDVLLAILAFALWFVELTIWLVTILPALLNDLLTWPTRELIHELLVVPAWSFYMASRSNLVMQGFLLPKPEEISMGLVVLGMGAKGPLLQLRADLDDLMGFAAEVPLTEPSGLDATTRGAPLGYSTDPAYPRAMITDLTPPFWDGAPLDGSLGPSEFVAPWRYPDDNMAGRRNGWEAPRTHVGPYVQGDNAAVLMGGMKGTDQARAEYEAARTPQQTEAASSELLAMTDANLGDPINYGAYLMGQLTGTWTSPTVYAGHDDARPLPDFNLDADRGYAYQCWDYVRHTPSIPPTPRPAPATDAAEPDQWRCAPSDIRTELSQLGGPLTADELAAKVRLLYNYAEPFNVPQRYNSGDNVHHRSRYDPLKRLEHEYLPHPPVDPAPPPGGGCDIDLQVSQREMLDAMSSPTGRPIPS